MTEPDEVRVRTFDERAAEWDTPERAERAALVADVIRGAVPLSRSMRAIDIGAGTGLLGLALAGDVGEVVLAEPSAGMRGVVESKLATGTWLGASVRPFDVAADPDADLAGAFDLAVSLLVLHHVEDTAVALARVARLLRPGGWMAIADLDAEDGSFHDADAEGVHHHGFDRPALESVARAAGFEQVSTRTATVIEHEDGSYPLFLLLGRKI